MPAVKSNPVIWPQRFPSESAARKAFREARATGGARFVRVGREHVIVQGDVSQSLATKLVSGIIGRTVPRGENPRFADYAEASAHARKEANRLGIDMAIRSVKEFGKPGFNVNIASRNDSDYARAEIVTPDKKNPTPKVEKLYREALAADDAWHAALEKKFGARAGDVRYTAKGKEGPLGTLHDRARRLREEYQSAVKEMRADRASENPLWSSAGKFGYELDGKRSRAFGTAKERDAAYRAAVDLKHGGAPRGAKAGQLRAQDKLERFIAKYKLNPSVIGTYRSPKGYVVHKTFTPEQETDAHKLLAKLEDKGIDVRLDQVRTRLLPFPKYKFELLVKREDMPKVFAKNPTAARAKNGGTADQLRSSIRSGEKILRTGKTADGKLDRAQLKAVRQSVQATREALEGMEKPAHVFRNAKKGGAGLPIMTVTQGSKRADLYEDGPNKFQVVIKGDKPQDFASVKAAASFARLRLAEVANRPARAKAKGPFSAKALRKLQSNPAKKNPSDAAQAQYEMFHGIPSTQLLEYRTKEHVHEFLWAAGTLVSMVVVGPRGGEIVLRSPDPDDTSFSNVVMCSFSEDGKQCYFVGGDQGLPLDELSKALAMTHDDVRDNMEIGRVKELTYRTFKNFEEGGEVPIDFYHAMGKEHSQGVLPILAYKPLDESMFLVGGRYKILPKDRQLGASPGIAG